jgi:hypothetical protein
VSSGGRNDKCGKLIKIDDGRPNSEGVQIMYFVVEKQGET